MLMLALLIQAATSHADATVTAKKAYDPNRVTCQTEDVTGSRLGSQKRCMTAAQRADQLRQQRLDLDHMQRLGRPDGGN